MTPEISDLPEVHPGSAGGANNGDTGEDFLGMRELAGVPVYGAAAAGYATAEGGRCAAGVLMHLTGDTAGI